MSTSGGRVVVNPDDEFGVVAVPNAGGGGSKGKGSTLGELEFLNYVTCVLCGFPYYSKTEENRKFWMTSCGHMLCGAREHNHQKGRCTRCKKEDIDVFGIGENLDPRLREWFGSSMEDHANTLAVLKRTVAELETGPLAVANFHNAELLRLVKLLRVNDERKEENIKIVKAELKKMSAMKKEISAMKAEIVELKRENVDLKSGRPVYPQAIPPPMHYGAAVNTLTPVAEEDNEEGYSDSGPQSIRRFELDLASNSGRQNGVNRYTTPRAMPSRITLPPTDRPATTEPYHDARATGSAPRVNLDKFRMTDTQPRTPTGYHPYVRPSSARPYSHARDNVGSSSKRPQEYPNSFMEGLPVNGQSNTFAPTGPTSGQQQDYSANPFQATPQYAQYAQQDDVNY